MPIVLPLVALDVLVLVLWTIAIALAIALIMRKVGDVFRHVPVVGGSIAGAVDSVAQVISNAAGSLEHGADRLAGAAWHQLARYMDHLWSHLVASSGVFAQMAAELLRHAHALSRLRALVHKAVGQAEAFVPRIKTLERGWHGIEHRVKTIEREIAKGIGHDLRIHVKALERKVTRLEQGVIPGLRAGIKTAEGEVSQLQDFIKAIPGTRYLDWAAGIVASVLSLEILNLLRCPQAKNVSKQRGCSMWGAMDDLLGLLALGIAAAEFETMVHEAQDLTHAATTVFDDVFGLSR